MGERERERDGMRRKEREQDREGKREREVGFSRALNILSCKHGVPVVAVSRSNGPPGVAVHARISADARGRDVATTYPLSPPTATRVRPLS